MASSNGTEPTDGGIQTGQTPPANGYSSRTFHVPGGMTAETSIVEGYIPAFIQTDTLDIITEVDSDLLTFEDRQGYKALINSSKLRSTVKVVTVR